MRYRRFGSTALTVSEVGFGCARLGGFFQSAGRPEIVRLLRSALDRGVTFFDTSDMYTQGESEMLLGEAFGRDRDAVVIATKAGYVLPGRRRVASVLKPVLRPMIRSARLRTDQLPGRMRGSLSQDFSPSHLISAAERSLRRLRTDHIDVFQLHSPPPEVLTSGAFLDPLDLLQRQGKVRYYGVSCETTADALACLGHVQISCIQLRLNLLDQSALTVVVPQATERGLGVVARECYGGGPLARPMSTVRPAQTVAEERRREGQAQELSGLERLAECHHDQLPQVALKFVLSQPGISVALLGMRTREQLESNLAHLAACSSWSEATSCYRLAAEADR